MAEHDDWQLRALRAVWQESKLCPQRLFVDLDAAIGSAHDALAFDLQRCEIRRLEAEVKHLRLVISDALDYLLHSEPDEAAVVLEHLTPVSDEREQ